MTQSFEENASRKNPPGYETTARPPSTKLEPDATNIGRSGADIAYLLVSELVIPCTEYSYWGTSRYLLSLSPARMSTLSLARLWS
jgi:hypothetical protein